MRRKNICHLFWFLMVILFSFLQKLAKTGKPNNSAEPANEFKATAVLPYVKGLSEQLRRCLQQQGVRAVFKSEITLKSQLVRPKDAVDQDRNAPIRAVEKQQITAEHHAL